MALILQRHSGHRPSFKFFTLYAHFSHILLWPQGCRTISVGHSKQMQHRASSSSTFPGVSSDEEKCEGVNVGGLRKAGCGAAFRVAAGTPVRGIGLRGTGLLPRPCIPPETLSFCIFFVTVLLP